MVKERTIHDVITYFVQAVALPLRPVDYRTLDISIFDIRKRMKYPDAFRAMLICLVYRSLPVAFPRYARELRETLEKIYQRAYERNKVEGKSTEEVVKEFNAMVEMNAERPFFKLATHVVGLYRRTPLATEQAEKLNQRLEQIYANFSTLGDDVQIVEQER